MMWFWMAITFIAIDVGLFIGYRIYKNYAAIEYSNDLLDQVEELIEEIDYELGESLEILSNRLDNNNLKKAYSEADKLISDIMNTKTNILVENMEPTDLLKELQVYKSYLESVLTDLLYRNEIDYNFIN